MTQFDWPALLRMAMREFGMQPAQFWSLTPAEFTLLVGPKSGAMPLTRDRLQELQAAYPDDIKERPGDTGI